MLVQFNSKAGGFVFMKWTATSTVSQAESITARQGTGNVYHTDTL